MVEYPDCGFWVLLPDLLCKPENHEPSKPLYTPSEANRAALILIECLALLAPIFLGKISSGFRKNLLRRHQACRALSSSQISTRKKELMK